MQFIDLVAQQCQQLQDGRTIREAVDSRIASVLNHGRYILGPEVEELETVLSAYVGVDHCIAVASGTDALLIALMALGVQAGDEAGLIQSLVMARALAVVAPSPAVP